MASFFRGRGTWAAAGSTAGYHAAPPSAPSASLVRPDYAAAFAGPDDDDDDRRNIPDPASDDEWSSPRPLHASLPYASSSIAAAAGDPLARPATSDPNAPVPASPPARTPLLPGAYDFEPQQEPARPPMVPAHSRPTSLHGSFPRPASLSSRRAVDHDHNDDDDDSHRYGRPDGSAAASAGGLPGWRGILARLVGTDRPGGASSASGHGDRMQRDGAAESHGLLFSHDESDDTDTDRAAGPAALRGGSGAAARYPPPSLHQSHMPLPARPPQFAAPPAPVTGVGGAGAGGRVFGGGQGNDGVFANLAAKPDNPNGDEIVGEGPGKDEVLPPYEAAQLDPSPQYWETTVITPGSLYGPDDILVDGLPVGNLFSFAWNLLVSMSFQFVGFILTYILHTTHAAKNGSRAGLGITLIQLGFYLKQRTDHPDYVDDDFSGDETGLNGALGPADGDAERWSWWGGGFDDAAEGGSGAATATLAALGSLPTQVGGALAGMLDASNPDATPTPTPFPTLVGDGVADPDPLRMSLAANEWMAFVMVTVGSFLLIGSCLAFWRAVRYARAIRQGQGPGADVETAAAF